MQKYKSKIEMNLFDGEEIATKILYSIIIAKSWKTARPSEAEKWKIESLMQPMHLRFPQKDQVAALYKIVTLYQLDTDSIIVIDSKWWEKLSDILRQLRINADIGKLKRELPKK